MCFGVFGIHTIDLVVAHPGCKKQANKDPIERSDVYQSLLLFSKCMGPPLGLLPGYRTVGGQTRGKADYFSMTPVKRTIRGN